MENKQSLELRDQRFEYIDDPPEQLTPCACFFQDRFFLGKNSICMISKSELSVWMLLMMRLVC